MPFLCALTLLLSFLSEGITLIFNLLNHFLSKVSSIWASVILSGGLNQRVMTEKIIMTSQGNFSLKYIFAGHWFLPEVTSLKFNSGQQKYRHK